MSDIFGLILALVTLVAFYGVFVAWIEDCWRK
jgi:hypothetical protein